MSKIIRTCPECGAQTINELDCWGKLSQILTWEWQDPELMAVHFLTVASYNLQHPSQFADEAIAGLGEVYIQYLDNSLALKEIRRRVGEMAGGSKKVLKPVVPRQPILKTWSMTINSVYIPDKPNGAAERVRAWAAAIRREL